MDSKIDDDFKDLIFTLLEINENDNTFELTVGGIYKDLETGLKISIQKGMGPGLIEDTIDRNAFYEDAITLISLGEKSDNLLKAISELYEVNINTKAFISRLSLMAFPLDGDPNQIRTSYLKFKLFNNTKEEDFDNYYFEIFLNIDIPAMTVELNEKDTDYRKQIISVLSAQTTEGD